MLGVDPGLTRCGLGRGRRARPAAPRLVAVGVVRTPADAPLGERLVALEVAVEAWLDEHQPDAVAVERVFAQPNVRTVMGTAQAGAVAVVCAARRGLPVALHTPTEVKAAVTGSGRADKAQVGLDGRPAAAAGRAAQARRRRRRARPRAVPPVARARRWPASPPPGGPRDRQRRRHRRRRCRRRRGACASAASAWPSRRPPARGPGCAWATRPSSRPRSSSARTASRCTASPTTTSATCSSCCRPPPASGRGSRRPCSPCTRPTRAPGAADRGPRRRCTLVPGIGRKGAQRMVLELKDKVGRRAAPPARRAGRAARWRDTLSGALVGLGWPQAQADDTVVAAGAGPTRTRAKPTCPRCCARRWPCSGEPVSELERQEAAELAGARPRAAAVRRSRRGRRPGAPEASRTTGRSRRRCGPGGSRSSSGRSGCASSCRCVLDSAQRRGRPAGPRPAVRRARARQDLAGHDHRGRARRRHPHHQRPGAWSGPATSSPSSPRWPRARCCSSTRSTASPGRPRSSSTWRWRTSGSTSSWARAPVPPPSRSTCAPFTLVGATTRAGLLTGPLRDRFGFTAHMEPYSPAELQRVLERSAGLLGVALTAQGAAEVAGRSRGTPRVANRLLRRVRDYAEVRPTASSPATSPRPRSPSTTSTSSASTGSTGPCSTRWCAGSAAAGRAVHARGRGERGARDRRGGRRAVPRALRPDRPHPPRPGGDAGRLAPPGPARRRGPSGTLPLELGDAG